MRRVLIAGVRWYQRHISAHTKPACRFTPTCSAYAIEALTRFGAVRGSILAVWRILRCNPLGTPGYDPVPERFTLKKQIQSVSIDDEEADSLYDGD